MIIDKMFEQEKLKNSDKLMNQYKAPDMNWKCSVCGEDADYSNNKIKYCHKHWWEKIQRGEIN